jgi:hypothetical protein
MSTNTYPALAIEAADYDEHPDTLHLCLPAKNGSSTGIRVATIEPDHFQTAGGDMSSRPAWETARMLAAAPNMLAALREMIRATAHYGGSHPQHDHLHKAESAALAAIARATTPTE